MKPHMENPALAGTGLPKSDLAGASICSESIPSLPPIQADPAAERRFAQALAERVFGIASNSQVGRLIPVVRRRQRIAA